MNALARARFRFEVRGREKVRGLQGPLIIAANHKKTTDPFLVSAALPFLSRIFPIRYMTEWKRYATPGLEFMRKTGLLYAVYMFLGAFPSRKGEGLDRALESPIRFLQNKQSVFIFPEGKRVQEDTIGDLKRGAVMLASRTNTPILPVAIRYKKEGLRTHCTVTLGELLQPSDENENGETLQTLRLKINELYEG